MWRLTRSSLFFWFTAAALFVSACFLRLYKLGSVPQGLTKDETYYGYDAYSILKTGRDIWGNRLPLSFKSTGEYKLNLTYFIVPAVKVLGLNETAVRLPSAVFGLATLLILFVTLKLLLKNHWMALLLTFVFALSPWAFGMSRLFYEGNVGLFFIAFGLYFIFSRRYLPAALSLATAAYLYSPYRYIGVGFLAVGLIFSGRSWRTWGKPAALYLLVLSPLLFFGAKGLTGQRLKEEWLLRKTGYEMKVNDMRETCYLETGKNPSAAKLCYPLWNKAVLYLSGVSRTFLEPFDPHFLFLKSDNEYVVPEEYGMYQAYLLPFYLLGIIYLFGYGAHPKGERCIRQVIAAAIVVSAGVVAMPGAVELYRQPVLMYLLFLLIGFGVKTGWQYATRLPKPASMVLLSAYVMVSLFMQSKYLVTYFVYTHKLPLLFASDVRQIYDFVGTKRDYSLIVDKKFHGPITAAFLWQIDPAYFQKNIIWTDPDPWGFINAYTLGNLQSQKYDVDTLLCIRHKNPSVPVRAVVIDDPGRYAQWADLNTYDFSGSLNLHSVYDIDNLYDKLIKESPGYLCK